MKKKTYVINLFGASGIGKSVTASRVYAETRMRGMRSELVREVAKKRAHANKPITGYDQVTIFGDQAEEEVIIYKSECDVLITDSPLLLCGAYEAIYLGREIATSSILSFMKYAEEDGVTYLNFWLKNYIKYEKFGRYETEEKSKENHEYIYNWLKSKGIELIEVAVPDRERKSVIVEHLIGVMNMDKDADQAKS